MTRRNQHDIVAGDTVVRVHEQEDTDPYPGLVIRRVEPRELLSMVFGEGDDFDMGEALWMRDVASGLEEYSGEWVRYEVLWPDGRFSIESIAQIRRAYS